jgi:hypothetical protein
LVWVKEIGSGILTEIPTSPSPPTIRWLMLVLSTTPENSFRNLMNAIVLASIEPTAHEIATKPAMRAAPVIPGNARKVTDALKITADWERGDESVSAGATKEGITGSDIPPNTKSPRLQI